MLKKILFSVLFFILFFVSMFFYESFCAQYGDIILPDFERKEDEGQLVIYKGGDNNYYALTCDYKGYVDYLKSRFRLNMKGTTYKIYKLVNNEWQFQRVFGSGIGADFGSTELDGIVYTQANIYDESTGALLKRMYFNVDVNFFEEENMYEFVTDFFNSSQKDLVKCYISSDGINYEDMIFSEIEATGEFCFYYDVYKNGTYYIKYVNSEANYEYVLNFDCNEIKEFELDFYLSNTEPSSEPIYILSNKFYFDFDDYDASKDPLTNYDIDICYGFDGAYEYAPFSVMEEDSEGTYNQYKFKVISNGVYKLRILNLETGDISYKTFNVSNVGFKDNLGNVHYYNNYNEQGEFDPTPVLFLDYLSPTSVRIRTQPFNFNELIYLECYFSSDGENYEKVDGIYKNTFDNGNSSYNLLDGKKRNLIDMYYFYYDVNIDGTYYFKFYNINLKKYSVGSIDVKIRDFVISNSDKIDKYPDRFIVWSYRHFGVLTYPLDFLINLVGRVLNINYTEPVLNIPELHEPFGNKKILNAISFNFNDILKTDTLKSVHNIYLICVDTILFVCLLLLCKKVFEEVFSG